MERPLEVFKMVTMAVKGMNNFMMYNGREGVYTHTVAYEKDDECPACSPGVRVEFSRDVALGDVVDACVKKFPNQCEKPSVSSATAGHLYMRGVFEEETRANLGKKLVDLVPDDADDVAGAGTAAEDGTARRSRPRGERQEDEALASPARVPEVMRRLETTNMIARRRDEMTSGAVDDGRTNSTFGASRGRG